MTPRASIVVLAALFGLGSALLFKDAAVLTGKDIGFDKPVAISLGGGGVDVYAAIDRSADNAAEYGNHIVIESIRASTNVLKLSTTRNESNSAEELDFVTFHGPIKITDNNNVTDDKRVPYVIFIVNSTTQKYPVYAAEEEVFNKEKFNGGATILNTFATAALSLFSGTAKNLDVFTCGFDSISDATYKILDVPIDYNSMALISSPIFTVVDERLDRGTSVQFAVKNQSLSTSFLTSPDSNMVISSPGWASTNSSYKLDQTYADFADGGFFYDNGTHGIADVQINIGELSSGQNVALVFTDGTSVKTYDLKSKANVTDKVIKVNSLRLNVAGVAGAKPDYLIKIQSVNGASFFSLFSSFLAFIAMRILW